MDDLQPDVPRVGGDDTILVVDPSRATRAARAFGAALGNTVPLTTASARDVAAMHDAAMARIQADDAGLATLMRTCIDCVVATHDATSPGSMTSGAAVGLVWISPAESWDTADLIEAYVHELAHTLLSLDEHRFGHYSDYARLTDSDTFAVSAIKEQRRPLQLVIHSIVVAAELLTVRDVLIGHDRPCALHGPSRDLARKTQAAVDSVRAVAGLTSLTTPRLRELLDLVAARLDATAVAA